MTPLSSFIPRTSFASNASRANHLEMCGAAALNMYADVDVQGGGCGGNLPESWFQVGGGAGGCIERHIITRTDESLHLSLISTVCLYGGCRAPKGFFAVKAPFLGVP